MDSVFAVSSTTDRANQSNATLLEDSLPSRKASIKRAGSFNTSVTEECSVDDTLTECSSKWSDGSPSHAPFTPSRRRSSLTMAVACKNSKDTKGSSAISPIEFQNDDSFGASVDNDEWWQQNSPTRAATSIDMDHEASRQEVRLPKNKSDEEKSDELSMDSFDADSKTIEMKSKKKKKKTTKRICLKVKASDLKLTSQSLEGADVKDQEKLQEAIKLLRVEQKQKRAPEGGRRHSADDVSVVKQRSASRGRRSSAGDTSTQRSASRARRMRHDGEEPSRGRSKSQARRKSEEEGAEEEARQRSKSQGRPDRAKSVSRRRSQEEEEDHKYRRSKSVGRRASQEEGSDRSRSVARKRPENEEGEDRRRSKSVGRRSRSVARKHSEDLDALARGSGKSTEDPGRGRQREVDDEPMRRSRSLAKGRQEQALSRGRLEAARSRSEDEGDVADRRRSKSLGRTLQKNSRDTAEGSRRASGSLSGDEESINHQQGTTMSRSARPRPSRSTSSRNISDRRIRSKSLCRRKSKSGVLGKELSKDDVDQFMKIANNSYSSGDWNKLDLEVESDKEDGQAFVQKEQQEKAENPEPQSQQRGVAVSKSIPWNEFLLQAQASSRSLCRDADA